MSRTYAWGHVEDLCDEVLLVEYPDRPALVAMAGSPDWASISEHRNAGLEGQLNIETTHVPGVRSVAEPHQGSMKARSKISYGPASLKAKLRRHHRRARSPRISRP